MAFLGTLLNTVGALFLTHAVYSAHEHTTAFSSSPLPTDITLELLFSIVFLSIGIVSSSQPLRPIQTAKWAGQMSREGRRPDGQYTREGEAILSEGDPYAFLGLDGGFGEGKTGAKGEGRRGFWDVKAKRREYEEWVRSGSKQ
ncbi:magnesium transporter [Ampelomyces quisqualis]|uniref:Magnesium transporter n=1 Tax=Ampelomyces quisqualis TaxID=50730 RepID=A0A6A5QJS7_AMPQU|nr:magnesium transporter [Ampelomyces quisqualis]